MKEIEWVVRKRNILKIEEFDTMCITKAWPIISANYYLEHRSNYTSQQKNIPNKCRKKKIQSVGEERNPFEKRLNTAAYASAEILRRSFPEKRSNNTEKVNKMSKQSSVYIKQRKKGVKLGPIQRESQWIIK